MLELVDLLLGSDKCIPSFLILLADEIQQLK
jgi:hypothetical protein